LESKKKRKDEIALGWIFLTIEETLAQEILQVLGEKRNADGSTKKAELRELDTRSAWERIRQRIRQRMDPERKTG
jgi:hypothetical protein